MSNFKRMVRARIAKTGEGWQAASRHVHAQGKALAAGPQGIRAVRRGGPKLYDLTKPTFYLDQSTLCDAFRAHTPGESKPVDLAYLPLRPWMERVAHEANLCISPIHLLELAKWGDTALADALCRWLDGLPLVAVYGLHRVKDVEEDAWVRRAAGLPVAEIMPFATSLLAAFVELSPDVVSRVLTMPEPLTYTLGLMRDHGIHKRHENLPFEFASQLRANRSLPQFAGLTPEQGQAILDQNTVRDLNRLAGAAIRRVSETDEAFVERSEPSGLAHKRALDLYDRDLRVLPLFRIETLFSHGLSAGIVRRSPGSRSDDDALSGASEDGLHLVGAAYCDVFTCDRATSRALGDVRTKLGRRPQFAIGGHPGGVRGFVSDLMATWP